MLGLKHEVGMLESYSSLDEIVMASAPRNCTEQVLQRAREEKREDNR